MIERLRTFVSGDGLKAKALRGMGLTVLTFGGTNLLRLGSNLVLTRLLFPEAFGLMALVQVFINGLQMFSDFGLRASIIQNARGDEPDFLNTGWTIQILRGVLLWFCTWAVAAPAARFYEEPMLEYLLPVAGIGAFVAGFNSTKLMSANRHLRLGRLTAVELLSQAAGVVVIIWLAWWLQSVWALVYGGIAAAVIKMALSHVMLPGALNRLKWEKSAALSFFNFGKFILISTLATFLINNADRAILGKYITLTELSVYTIAFFLASVPTLLNQQLVSAVVFPLYGRTPPGESLENRRQLSRLRLLITGGLFAFSIALALIGDALIDLLYDPRYALAGPILILLSLSRMPEILISSYTHLPLAAGNSGQFSTLNVLTALVRTGVLFIGIADFGLTGGILAPALATLLTYPLILWIARRHQGWDPLHDLLFTGVGLAATIAVLWYHAQTLHPLLPTLAGQMH